MCNAMDTLERDKCDSRNGFEFQYCLMSAPSVTNLGGPRSTDVSGQGPPHPEDAALCEGNIDVECDYFDGVLKYINQMLMEEEDLDHRPCMFHDCLALQAAEKTFYDALIADDSPSLSDIPSSSVDQNPNNSFDAILSQCPLVENKILESGQSSPNSSFLPTASDVLLDSPTATFQIIGSSSSSKNQSGRQFRGQQENETQLTGNQVHCSCILEQDDYTPHGAAEKDKNKDNNPPNGSRDKRNHCRGDDESVEEGRTSKQFAGYTEESEEMEKYDEALLCQVMNPGFYDEPPPHKDESSQSQARKKYQYQGSKRGRPRAGEKRVNMREVVDLRTLFIQCAQAMANYDSSTAYEQLRRIRQHSSPYGDTNERLAHCFANALEARLAGTGTELYTALNTRRISAADILKAYQVYVASCPFKRMSNIFSSKSIGKLTSGATTIHIIDFGILYGFQWPCFIQGISLRPGDPPKLRITGIDLPQRGFRPAERVEETGHRLEKYCKRFNVPFEYTAIAKKWDSISLEDLKIVKNEITVVNCLYRLRHVPDETVMEYSPRDTVLGLIKKINPDLFVHGIVNGTFNSPFFVTRFREALFHFSSLFDMFDATVPREDQERLLYEKAVLGRDAMNVIACEGTERVERPETYKQWQVRNQRAGFRQLPLNQNIMREVRTKVKLHYHKDFLVDEDSNWMLQGWKGRVIYALSCWKPVYD